MRSLETTFVKNCSEASASTASQTAMQTLVLILYHIIISSSYNTNTTVTGKTLNYPAVLLSRVIHGLAGKLVPVRVLHIWALNTIHSHIVVTHLSTFFLALLLSYCTYSPMFTHIHKHNMHIQFICLSFFICFSLFLLLSSLSFTLFLS